MLLPPLRFHPRVVSGVSTLTSAPPRPQALVYYFYGLDSPQLREPDTSDYYNLALIVQLLSIAQGLASAVIALSAAFLLHRLGGDFVLFWPIRNAAKPVRLLFVTTVGLEPTWQLCARCRRATRSCHSLLFAAVVSIDALNPLATGKHSRSPHLSAILPGRLLCGAAGLSRCLQRMPRVTPRHAHAVHPHATSQL